MTEYPLYHCGELQTVRHIIESCSQRKYAGGMLGIHQGGSDATERLTNLDI